jgi:protein-S-isoprenylcysteine O-methyltransferase Ste14
MKRWLMFVQFCGFYILLAAVLFGGAGRFDVPRLWAYIGAYLVIMLVGVSVLDPSLYRERVRPGGKRRPWSLHILSALFVTHLLVAGIEAGRYRWTPPVPLAVECTGFVAFTVCFAVVLWAMHVNPFYSSVVRIQTERGHTLVTNGPYRWVRHPGYAATLVVSLASGMALGSWAAVVVLSPLVPFILYRAVTEDAFLKKNLPGYPEYAARVRHRLLPGVW